jgi:hypothetical protein
MPDTDFHQPDLGPLRAAAETAELAHAASGLVSATDTDPLAPLAREIARSMAEAGRAVHRCAPHDPLCRLGGVCLLPVPAGPADGRGGVAVPWTTHSLLLLDWGRSGICTGTQQAMNAAIGGILRAFGYAAEPSGSGGAWLVTGRHRQEAEAGR